MGFFTDTSVCIGCKACEVACKTWNEVPEDGLNLLGMSYDNTGALGASTWRHVAFIEQIARREEDGQAHKCTLCYDRLGAGMEPACAKACPTESIQFGPLDELRERAALRVADLQAAGQDHAQLYLDDPDDGIGGGGAFFLLLDEPEVYGLPPDPVVTTRDLPRMWKHVAVAAGALLLGGLAASLRPDLRP